MPTRKTHDEEEEAPRKKRRPSTEDDDDDEPKPKKKRAAEEDDDTKPSSGGWSGVAKRKTEVEKKREAADSIRNFFLKDGEEAIIQFVDADPICVDGHNIKFDDGNWAFTPCQLITQRHCLMCREGIKKTWRAAFKILDYRGTWDKEKKRFKNDTQVEKIWWASQTVAEQLQVIKDKKKKALTDLVFDVMRSGSGKTTSYNITVAVDEDEKRLMPIDDYELKFPKTSKLATPLDDEELEARGFSAE